MLIPLGITWPIPIQTSALLCRVVAVGTDHFRFEQLCQGGKRQLRASDEIGIQRTKRALNLTWTNNVTGGKTSRITVYKYIYLFIYLFIYIYIYLCIYLFIFIYLYTYTVNIYM